MSPQDRLNLLVAACRGVVDDLLCDNDENERCDDHPEQEKCNPCLNREALRQAVAKARRR